MQHTGDGGVGMILKQIHVLIYITLLCLAIIFSLILYLGNLRHGFVAGAACPSEVINFLDDVGIPICEGYGLTETSPIISINTPYDRNPGFVGKPIKGVSVVIMGEDGNPAQCGVEGEICCYGPNIMRGYYKNPAATEEVISLASDGKSRL